MTKDLVLSEEIAEVNRKIREDKFGINAEASFEIDFKGKMIPIIEVEIRGSHERFRLRWFGIWIEIGPEVRGHVKLGLVSAKNAVIDEKRREVIITG